ncbi:MAG: ComEC family competence protein [Rhizobiales bacterium]|nr:ComEC family competence protein [Hyphomicrobiales bacterium]
MTKRDRAGGRAQIWPEIVAARRRKAATWFQDASRFTEWAQSHLRTWILADTGPGRLLPWFPIAFGFGIALYFTADREPAVLAALGALAAGILAAIRLHQRPLAFPLALAFTAIAAGFATATVKRTYIAHPVLHNPAIGVVITGFVEVSEERARSDRIIVRVLRLEGLRERSKLERVRVSIRKGQAPRVGTYVTFKARLNSPLQPLRPGGYDFARDLYFQGIGATGFVLGRITVSEPPVAGGAWLRYASAIAAMRDAIDARIRSVLSGDKGAIASALITGKRDAISTPVSDAMYVSSLAHVLSISGYHMAVVAGVVFFFFRASFALVPSLAIRYPIKKWAALAALFAAAFYLLLSGAEVATQRSFIMTAIVLIGVMTDRPALTLRTIAVAAMAVLLIAPEALVHPSFQMSFAASLALIAGYQHGLPWLRDAVDTSIGSRIALWGGREIVGLILASVLAGLATTPYAAYHFHRLAPYGVIANLLAMPIVSVWVMPAGLLALLAIPFGFDAPLWRAMGDGIDWMIAVALWVANLPGAVGRMAAFGTGPLLLCTAGLILLCLLRTKLRWSGACLIVAATTWAVMTPLPDIRIAADAGAVGVRGTDGRLLVMKNSKDPFAVREWLAADADSRAANDLTLGTGIRCDDAGCIASLADGRMVALSLAPEAFGEDCRRASVIITPRKAPPGCSALVIDRDISRASGAIELYPSRKGFAMTAARPKGFDRPWASTVPQALENVSREAGRPRTLDATPRAEDLDADD